MGKKEHSVSKYKHVLKESKRMKDSLAGGISLNLSQCKGECEELFMLGLMREFPDMIFVDNMTNLSVGSFSLHIEVNPSFLDGKEHNGFLFIFDGDLSDDEQLTSSLFVMFDSDKNMDGLNLDSYKEEHEIVANHQLPLIHFSLDDLRVFNLQCVREAVKVIECMWFNNAYRSTKSREFLKLADDLWSNSDLC